MQPIPYSKQDITDQDIESVVNTLKSDFLTQGPQISTFEDAFSTKIESRFAVACANGTAALHLSALALNVDQRSHFITTPITFAASSNAILYCNGKISFCDIDLQTGLMDLEKLDAMVSAKPKGFYTGVVGVDLAGYPLDFERLQQICKTHNLSLIEDGCHAPGGFFHDSKGNKQKCGNGKYSNAAIFSFHPVKHIATGEGGMITTNDQALSDRMKLLRTHGIIKDPAMMSSTDGPWYYEMKELGYNYRIPDILCALGTSQLSRLEDSLKKRHAIAFRYDEAFAKHEKIHPLTPAGTTALAEKGISHAFHLYIIKTDQRLELYQHLASKKIYCQVHYIPVYRLPFYSQQGHPLNMFPNAEQYYKTALSIPMYPSLSENEQSYVIENILGFFK